MTTDRAKREARDRAVLRFNFVRQHSPALLAAKLSGLHDVTPYSKDAEMVSEAVTLAATLFDELERWEPKG